MQENEAVEILNACKPLVQRLRRFSDYQFNNADKQVAQDFGRFYRAKLWRNTKLLDAAGVPLHDIAFLVGHLIIRKELNRS